MEIATIIILAILLLAQGWMNSKDRRDLLDRIMCRDYEEYKRFKKTPAAHRAYPATMSDAEMKAAADAEQMVKDK